MARTRGTKPPELPKQSKSRNSPFPRVQEAREALRERAMQILDDYLAVIRAAQADGDHDVAAKSLQWLMTHMPDTDGVRMLDPSIDRPDKVDDSGGASKHSIQIGIAIGGVPAPKQVEGNIIAVTDNK